MAQRSPALLFFFSKQTNIKLERMQHFCLPTCLFDLMRSSEARQRDGPCFLATLQTQVPRDLDA